MNWLLIFTSLFSVCQSTLTKLASDKDKDGGVMRFNAVELGASLVFFLAISLGGFSFHMPTFLYASLYGIAMFFSNLFGYLALMSGSMALSSLIVSYSVVIPCFFGIAFLKEDVSSLQIVGLLLLALSMLLLKRQADGGKMSKKWLIYVVVTFIANGVSSIVQKMHQTEYPELYCSEFMVYYITVTFVLFIIAAAVKKEKRSAGSAKYAIPAGILMGLSAYITLLLSATVNASVLFPITCIAQMLFKVVISKLLFKDKFSIAQLFGIGLGVISVLLVAG